MSNWIVWLLQFVLPRRYWYRKMYLYSHHWRSFRQRYGKKHRWQCAKCRRRATDLHHLVYYLWRETARDVQLLCRPCHRLEHGR